MSVVSLDYDEVDRVVVTPDEAVREAIAGAQSAALVRDYKNHPVRAVRLRHRLIINWLL